ncbi:DNA internalization-related competence protein ComEC/Rec2 [Gilvimarinus polysaccharolyticus]|uniref:DNA internalization-related competence protein ComEC/Rec2 n=1 Tax=Gilvimarinus polysaccharolyticus TaxID=863921 RepID=UPI00067367CF|nr:DNA internalization-related competence protein ComEC/Rec2 [Gilvimarinus polysaccharolyticus]
MYRILFTLVAGLTLPSFLPWLLPLGAITILALLLCAVWLLVRRRYQSPAAVLLIALLFNLGFVWGSWSLQMLLANQLDPALEGQDVLLQGVIDSPVKHDHARVQMLLTPSHDAIKGRDTDLPRRIQVSWYRAPDWAETLTLGDHVALKVRLKRPRSFVNPVGFDYKLWQLRRGVGAVGYVRADANNQRLAHTAPAGLRVSLGLWLKRQQPTNDGLIGALLLGQRGDLTDNQRQLLQSTGTSHLIAISGLHIGLAATFGYLLALLMGKLLAAVIPWRAHIVAFVGAALAAWGYSMLAGFSLPTQRALAMLVLLYCTRVLGKHYGGGVILAAAALLVCTLDPLSPRDAGFWLSFTAVASLILIYDGLITDAHRWQSLWLPQLVVFVALLVPLGVFFGQVSLISPLANFVAIPLVSLLVVPLLFAAAISSWLNDSVAGALLWLADRVLDGFWWWLESLARTQTDYNWPISVAWQPQPVALLLIALSAVLLLLPQSLKLRTTGLLLAVLGLAVPPPKPPLLAMTVMDVGQGLAVVVQAGNHSLVYDAGPRYSDNFDAGADIIAPFLRKQGLQEQGTRRLDTLVVSHAHADHAGGAVGLLEVLPSATIYLGEPLAALSLEDTARAMPCGGATVARHTKSSRDDNLAGDKIPRGWRWGAVEFRFLTLPSQHSLRGNSASCVLLIDYQGYRLLLTGDIERPLEAEIVAVLAELGVTNVDLLVAPHHGSKTSSSAALVNSLMPATVVFSAGFNNRHGHPHAEVVTRYQRVGSQIYNTAVDGAISFYIDPAGVSHSRAQRQLVRRPWRD